MACSRATEVRLTARRHLHVLQHRHGFERPHNLVRARNTPLDQS
jgi:hypothetical protein